MLHRFRRARRAADEDRPSVGQQRHAEQSECPYIAPRWVGRVSDVPPGATRSALATIGGNIRWRVDFTTDRDELRESAGEIFVTGGAGPILLDGIKETWDRRFEDEESWPVFVVVVTDGTESSGNMNQNEYAELMNELISNVATVHIMLLSTRGGSVVTDYAINLTDNTGGLYEVFSAGTRLATALPEVATRLGTHYDEVS